MTRLAAGCALYWPHPGSAFRTKPVAVPGGGRCALAEGTACC